MPERLGFRRLLAGLGLFLAGSCPAALASPDLGTADRDRGTTSTMRHLGHQPGGTVLAKTAINPAPWQAPKEPAAGVLLVASPELQDPNFGRSVVLLLDHDQEGALGVVINRPSEFKLEQVLPDIDELRGKPHVVYIGGPVDRQRLLLLLRSDNRPENASELYSDLHISSSLEALKSAAQQAGTAADYRAYAGYAGWGPRQLENEIRRGDWKLQQGTTAIVMRADVSGLWDELIRFSNELWVLKR